MTTLAMDIGGTKLAAALLDSNLQIRERRELPTPASKTPEALRYKHWLHRYRGVLIGWRSPRRGLSVRGLYWR